LSDAVAAHAGHGHGHGDDHHHPDLQHHFESLQQQHEASTLGMWLFLITEVMFFGGLFMAYLLYRVWYPEAWIEGSNLLDIRLGGFNTIVLIGSSLTMAMAVRAAQTGFPKATVNWLLITIVLGTTFLVVKYFEYASKFALNEVPGLDWAYHSAGGHERQVEIFLSLYFLLTGLHATHMVIGFFLLSVIAWMAYRRRFTPAWYTPVEMAGLYWHFVDIVWIFLFPLLYLVDRTVAPLTH
jgi:cytochrome c oxidase subunit III